MIEQLAADDWERYRVLRLRALADTPDAFGSTSAEESNFSREDWLERFLPSAANFAICRKGKDVGLITCAPYDDCAGLYSMWVDPDHRGNGLGGLLVHAVINWARDQGHVKLLLDVGDYNAPAIALYRSRGFLATGIRGTLPPPRQHITEHQRVLDLA